MSDPQTRKELEREGTRLYEQAIAAERAALLAAEGRTRKPRRRSHHKIKQRKCANWSTCRNRIPSVVLWAYQNPTLCPPCAKLRIEREKSMASAQRQLADLDAHERSLEDLMYEPQTLLFHDRHAMSASELADAPAAPSKIKPFVDTVRIAERVQDDLHEFPWLKARRREMPWLKREGDGRRRRRRRRKRKP